MAQITTGLVGNPTTHYSFSYDSSLERTATNPAGPEPARTNAIIAACEADFALMSGWFGNPALDYNIPATVQITPNGGGAGWGLGGGNLGVTLNPGNGDANFCRYLLVAEMTEQFMREQGRGWYGQNTEGSEGEGLSRFLAARFLAINGLGYPPAGFDNSNAWMSSAGRNDYVNNINRSDDGPDAITGCSLLFIYYLFSQLGFTIEQIVAAGAPTLAGVYNNLTGDTGDPFPYFKALVGSAYPGTATILGPDLDNPFPLAMPLQVWTWDGWGWGTFDIAFPFGRSVLNRHSHCEMSICELAQPPGQPLDYPFIGAATMTVLNVAPTDDGVVNVRFQIDWGSTLQWRATFFIA
jgi:hypothetical protein